MKHLRIYESFRDIKVSDIVRAIDTLPKNKFGYQLIAGNKYKIMTINDGYASVEDMDGNYKGYYLLARFLPEIEYHQDKFNL